MGVSIRAPVTGTTLVQLVQTLGAYRFDPRPVGRLAISDQQQYWNGRALFFPAQRCSSWILLKQAHRFRRFSRTRCETDRLRIGSRCRIISPPSAIAPRSSRKPSAGKKLLGLQAGCTTSANAPPPSRPISDARGRVASASGGPIIPPRALALPQRLMARWAACSPSPLRAIIAAWPISAISNAGSSPSTQSKRIPNGKPMPARRHRLLRCATRNNFLRASIKGSRTPS